MIHDGWTDLDGVRLHHLAADGAPGSTPLVYVPGSLGSAEDAREELRRLAPRPCVAISPRGTGRSDAPERGYGLEDRVRDLDGVLAAIDPHPFCLMAYSRGVPIALAYTAKRPERVRGLILIDHPARYGRYSERWAEGALPFARERGVPEHVVRRMREESRDVDLWEEAAALSCPALIVRGGRSPVLSEEDVERYRTALPQARVVVFEEAGHDVWNPDHERFLRTVEGFLGELDGEADA